MIARLDETGGSIARVTAELHDRNQNLAALNDLKNQSSDAAHDLRNPLAVFWFHRADARCHIGKLSPEQEQWWRF